MIEYQVRRDLLLESQELFRAMPSITESRRERLNLSNAAR